MDQIILSDPHTIIIDDVRVEYGRIPSELAVGFTGIVYYFKTRSTCEKETHTKIVQTLVDSLISKNDTDYTSWELTDSELIQNHICQITTVSFRMRDSY